MVNNKELIDLKKDILRMIKMGYTLDSILDECELKNVKRKPNSLKNIYYAIMKEMREKWEDSEFGEDIKGWIKDQYLFLYEKSSKANNIKEARNILNDLSKITGIAIQKNEITLSDSVIKFKFDLEEEDNEEDNGEE